jgi:Zn-dependent peptidase ImmA (M78 family)
MLVLARDEAGLTQLELASSLGISQGNLSRLESGIISLTEDVETRLVEVLNRPPGFFRYSGPIEAPTFVLFRKKESIPPAIRKQFWAKITIATIKIRQLLSGAEIATPQLPYFDPDECPGGVVAVAKRIRRMWKLAPGPVKNIMRLAENAGCIVLRFDFGTRKIDGCSAFIDGVPVIFVNSNLSAVRQKMTVAHELGHLVMHRFPSEDAEDEAFLFASELLMPEDEISPMLRPLSFDRLARLKLYWEVSIAALVKRAEGLGLISGSTSRYYWAKMTQMGYRDCEPYDKELPAESPTLIPEIIETYLNDLKYSEQELATLMLEANPAMLNAYRGFGNSLRVVKYG